MVKNIVLVDVTTQIYTNKINTYERFLGDSLIELAYVKDWPWMNG